MENGSCVQECFDEVFQWVGGGEEDVSEEKGAVFGFCEIESGVWCYLLGSRCGVLAGE